LDITLHHNASNTALPQVNGHAHTHGASAHNHHIGRIHHLHIAHFIDFFSAKNLIFSKVDEPQLLLTKRQNLIQILRLSF
jgi:hypothetical protein